MSRLADALNQWMAENPGVNPLAETGGNDVLVEIRDLLKSIDAKLTPTEPAEAKRAQRPAARLGRVFSAGQLIPSDVDLVMGDGGLRWIRLFEQGPVASTPTDDWRPRDVEGPVVSSNELLSRAGHVTEIPAPGKEATQ